VGRIGARENKRDTEQAIPDKRITRLHEVLNLTGRSVLEVGCFEGIHTLGLCGYGAEVTAIDIRPVNVVKTLVRLSAFGQSARVFVCDVEDEGVKWPHFDVVFHCGVLYHLEDPVRHLKAILPRCSAIYLDTHIAGPDNSADALDTCGKRYFGYRFREGGWSDPFSGRAETAFWLQLKDVTKLLDEQGFATQLWSERSERNGPRVGLFAHRSVEVTAA
jgi:tRNA (mo5U34)-methyltransferase